MRTRTKKTIAYCITAAVIVILWIIAGTVSGGETGSEHIVNTFWAMVPPLIAIGLALVTKEVYSSLLIGIISGALIYAGFKPVEGLNVMLNDGIIGSLTDGYNMGIIIFLVLLGIMVAVINKSGVSSAYGRWAKTHIKSRRAAMFSTFILGILIFVDDYFNCLTVGSVMKPVSDNHKISRAKLAYIIDATAAPVCMIAPVSSWAAAVSGLVVGTNGFLLFVQAIPFNFYSIMTFVMIIFLIVSQMDFGSMAKHEKNAIENGDLFTQGTETATSEEIEENPRARVIDLVIPVVALIACCIIGLVYSGGLFSGETFIDAFANADASVGLMFGAFIALIFTFIYYSFRRIILFGDFMRCIPKGFIAMVPAIIILTFAWTLKAMTGLLGAQTFVEIAMSGAGANLFYFMPCIIFLVAVGMAFATGTSWGTFGILIPIVAGVFSADTTLGIIGISACLAGAVCGDHCSPISDTTIMSSAGARCDHINHVSTQLPYALTVALGSFICFLLAGVMQMVITDYAASAVISIVLGIVVMLVILFIIRGFKKRRA